MNWRSRGADPAEIDTLYAGVPAWLERDLIGWARVVSSEEYRDEWDNSRRRPSARIMSDYETATRRKVSLVDKFVTGGVPHVFGQMLVDEFLDFVDFLVFVASQRSNADQVLAALETILDKSGSEWSVGERDGLASLVKRVPEGVAIAVKETIRSRGLAGQLLGEAWHAAFGRDPDTEEAYEKAIKAVEEAGVQVVLPKNPKATLGTMAQTLEDQSSWKLSLVEDPVHASSDVVAKMSRALWSGQESRHGGNGYRKPTQEEAEAAVMLAVPLVQFFTSGAIARR
jgi:hypothetical protein